MCYEHLVNFSNSIGGCGAGHVNIDADHGGDIGPHVDALYPIGGNNHIKVRATERGIYDADLMIDKSSYVPQWHFKKSMLGDYFSSLND